MNTMDSSTKSGCHKNSSHKSTQGHHLLPHITLNRSSHWFKYALLVGVLIATFCTLWLASDGTLGSLDERLLGDIYTANDRFIDSAAERAESMTLTLAELHAGLLVLQSSEFGISFFVDANIQLGNVIAQLTDMVAYGRNFALFNLVALHVIDNLLLLIQWLTPWLIVAAELGLLAIVVSDTWLSSRNRWHMSLIRFGEGLLVAVLLLAIIFPLSVSLVSHSSKAVTESLFNESYQAIVDTHKHLLTGEDGASIKEDASSTLKQFSTVRVKLSEKSSYIATNLTRYIASTLLEVFLLPLLFSAFMLWFVRALIRRHRHWSH